MDIGSHIDTKTRTVWLPREVDSEMLQLVSESLHAFKNKSVTFRLDSEGGSEDQGLAICDLIRRHGRVTIQVEGTAQSMAAVILQSAKKRLIMQNSFLMLHLGTLSMDDTHKKNVKALIRITDWQDERCNKIVMQQIRKKYPKYTYDEFCKNTNFDAYFTAEEALKWGLVDKII